MFIQKASFDDLNDILEIYDEARSFMIQTGNPNQWATRRHPPESVVRADIEAKKLYICKTDENLQAVGVFFYDFGERIEPTYNRIKGEWISGEIYGVVHRIATKTAVKGVGTFCLNWAFQKCNHLRIDTHADNKVMQNLLTKLGFTECGIINLENGDERIAYEKANLE